MSLKEYIYTHTRALLNIVKITCKKSLIILLSCLCVFYFYMLVLNYFNETVYFVKKLNKKNILYVSILFSFLSHKNSKKKNFKEAS